MALFKSAVFITWLNYVQSQCFLHQASVTAAAQFESITFDTALNTKNSNARGAAIIKICNAYEQGFNGSETYKSCDKETVEFSQNFGLTQASVKLLVRTNKDSQEAVQKELENFLTATWNATAFKNTDASVPKPSFIAEAPVPYQFSKQSTITVRANFSDPLWDTRLTINDSAERKIAVAKICKAYEMALKTKLKMNGDSLCAVKKLVAINNSTGSTNANPFILEAETELILKTDKTTESDVRTDFLNCFNGKIFTEKNIDGKAAGFLKPLLNDVKATSPTALTVIQTTQPSSTVVSTTTSTQATTTSILSTTSSNKNPTTVPISRDPTTMITTTAGGNSISIMVGLVTLFVLM